MDELNCTNIFTKKSTTISADRRSLF